MSRRHVSQREAHAAIARVKELEQVERERRSRWLTVWPGGVQIGGVDFTMPQMAIEAAVTARRLGHAVVVVPSDDRKRITLYALPLDNGGE